MFKIESKAKNGGIWDGKKVQRFEKGVLMTNDTALAERARGIKGVTVSGNADTLPSDKFTGMDIEQLKAYAAENKIDIGNASSAVGIIKKIAEAEVAGG